MNCNAMQIEEMLFTLGDHVVPTSRIRVMFKESILAMEPLYAEYIILKRVFWMGFVFVAVCLNKWIEICN